MKRIMERSGLTLCWILAATGGLSADITIDDGLVHEIVYPVAERVDVYDDTAAHGNGSIVDVSEGARFASEVHFWDHSRLTMSGGACYGDLAIHDHSVASISGGLVDGILFASEDSHTTLSGDAEVGGCYVLGGAALIVEGEAFVGYLETVDVSTVDIRGGRFGMMTLSGATVDISGGVFQGQMTVGSSGASISGGTFQSSIWVGSTLDVSGGEFGGEIVLSTPTTNLIFVGGEFAMNGQPIEPDSSIHDLGLTETIWRGWTCLTGVVTGTLADGSPLDQTVYLIGVEGNGYGDIEFIPEPASLWLALVGAWLVRRRDRPGRNL